MLRIQIDTARLWEGDDLYRIWLSVVIDRVFETRRAQAEEEERRVSS